MKNLFFLIENIVTSVIDFGKRPAVLVRLRPRQWTYLGEHMAIAYLNTSKLVGIAYIHLVKVRPFAPDFPYLFECVLYLQESMKIVPNWLTDVIFSTKLLHGLMFLETFAKKTTTKHENVFQTRDQFRLIALLKVEIGWEFRKLVGDCSQTPRLGTI